MKEIKVGTTKVKANFTKEMIEDLSKMKSMDELLYEMERKEIYERRKRIIEKLLNK